MIAAPELAEGGGDCPDLETELEHMIDARAAEGTGMDEEKEDIDMVQAGSDIGMEQADWAGIVHAGSGPTEPESGSVPAVGVVAVTVFSDDEEPAVAEKSQLDHTGDGEPAEESQLNQNGHPSCPLPRMPDPPSPSTVSENSADKPRSEDTMAW